jgi:hypothetical protein
MILYYEESKASVADLKPGCGFRANEHLPVSRRALECQYQQVTPHTTPNAATSRHT